MMYKVIVRFTDLQDNKHVYNVGDEFPRVGAHPSKKRIAELASGKNRRKIPLIEEVAENDIERDLQGDAELVQP